MGRLEERRLDVLDQRVELLEVELAIWRVVISVQESLYLIAIRIEAIVAEARTQLLSVEVAREVAIKMCKGGRHAGRHLLWITAVTPAVTSAVTSAVAAIAPAVAVTAVAIAPAIAMIVM